MIKARTFAGKTVAVFGLGLSGLAAARSLLAGGATVLAWDDGEQGRAAGHEKGLPVYDLGEADWTKIDALVLAPGVPLTHPEPHWSVKLAKAHGVEIIGDTEIFVRERRQANADTKLIAITGTNGKSTTTALIHHLLASTGVNAHLGGNIGVAVLDLPPFAEGCCYVLELSSFQLDLTPSLDPTVGVLLNITSDHLDRHGTMNNYAAVKAKMFAHPTPGSKAVIGADDAYCDAIADQLCKTQAFEFLRISGHRAVANGVSTIAGHTGFYANGVLKNVADLEGIASLRGDHNGQNAAAALAACPAAFPNSGWATFAAQLRTFPGLPHRMEEVRRIGRVLFINDSKATNADAAERALLSFKNIYWICGGKAKEGGISSLVPYLSRIKKAYLIGEAAPAFAEALGGIVPFSLSGTLDKAVMEAAADALKEEGCAAVLLSPACASYDQFANFEVRGDAFRRLVSELRPGQRRDWAA